MASTDSPNQALDGKREREDKEVVETAEVAKKQKTPASDAAAQVPAELPAAIEEEANASEEEGGEGEESEEDLEFDSDDVGSDFDDEEDGEDLDPLEIAQAMLAAGESIQMIMEYTNLSEEVIKSLN